MKVVYYHNLLTLIVFCIAFLSNVPYGYSQEVTISQITAIPGRIHNVAQGTITSFVAEVKNNSNELKPVILTVNATKGWSVAIRKADKSFRPISMPMSVYTGQLEPNSTAYWLIRLSPTNSLPDGTAGNVNVSLAVPSQIPQTLLLQAVTLNKPKLYILSIDALGPNYLKLNMRAETGDTSQDLPLLPNIVNFISDAANFSKATDLLPSITDSNHTTAITGSWVGTHGIPYAMIYYYGIDYSGHPDVSYNLSNNLLRSGRGYRVNTIFDVTKNPEFGGTPDITTALVSGKIWLDDLYEDEHLDIVARTYDRRSGGGASPYYISKPPFYVLGDPASDRNWYLEQKDIPFNLGLWSVTFPDDRWVAESALKIIAAEDPDVMDIIFAGVDDGQHTFGAADIPEEWDTKGTPQLWDDRNIYNKMTNREQTIDIVREADISFGMIIESLKDLKKYETSIISLYSDHGQITISDELLLDIDQIIKEAGLAVENYEGIYTGCDFGYLYIANSNIGSVKPIEEYLQNYYLVHRGKIVYPFIVINREEMDSGVDDIIGHFAFDGIAGNKKGELYSEWGIDNYQSYNPGRLRWPDLFIFTRDRIQLEIKVPQDAINLPWSYYVGCHGGLFTQDIILAMRGPGILKGIYDSPVTLAAIVPTIYHITGLTSPDTVNGRVLSEILP